MHAPFRKCFGQAVGSRLRCRGARQRYGGDGASGGGVENRHPVSYHGGVDRLWHPSYVDHTLADLICQRVFVRQAWREAPTEGAGAWNR